MSHDDAPPAQIQVRSKETGEIEGPVILLTGFDPKTQTLQVHTHESDKFLWMVKPEPVEGATP